MVQQKGRAKFEAGPVTFIVQHELWDGNVQDHSDQGVAVLVAKQDDETTLLRIADAYQRRTDHHTASPEIVK